MNRSTVIALGFFDGVHIGHGELLKMAVRRAQERGCLVRAGAAEGEQAVQPHLFITAALRRSRSTARRVNSSRESPCRC